MNEEINDLLSELAHLFKTELRRTAWNGEVAPATPLQGDVLAYLGRSPGANVNALADRIGRDRGQTTRLLIDMEKLGLIIRERSASNRRFVGVSLTSKGHEVYRRVLNKRAELAATMLENLIPEERRQLSEMLFRMRSNLRAKVGSAMPE